MDAAGLERLSGGNYHVQIHQAAERMGVLDLAGKTLGIDYTKTWSCYKGGEHHCGKCGTCVERKEALADAGIKDETIYEG